MDRMRWRYFYLINEGRKSRNCYESMIDAGGAMVTQVTTRWHDGDGTAVEGMTTRHIGSGGDDGNEVSAKAKRLSLGLTLLFTKSLKRIVETAEAGRQFLFKARWFTLCPSGRAGRAGPPRETTRAL